MAEVSAALLLIKKRVKPSDDFDVVRFLADASNVLSTPINSSEEWEDILRLANEKLLAKNELLSPWDQLDIDWSQFHSQARYVLDDPFFWDPSDDFAPDGNDTGAELLEEFRLWNKRNGNVSPTVFLEQLVAKWGVAPVDWDVTDDATVRRLRR